MMQVKSKRCILRQKQAITTSIGKLNSTQLHRRRGGARKYKGAIEINFQENKDKRVDLPLLRSVYKTQLGEHAQLYTTGCFKCTLFNFATRLTFEFRRTAFSAEWRPQIICESISYYLRCRFLLVAAPRQISDPMPKHFLGPTIRTMPCSIQQRVNRIHLCLFDVSSHCIRCIVSDIRIVFLKPIKSLMTRNMSVYFVSFVLNDCTILFLKQDSYKKYGVSLKHSKLWDNTVVVFFKVCMKSWNVKCCSFFCFFYFVPVLSCS